MRARTRPLSILLVEDNPGDALLVGEALAHGRIMNTLDVQASGKRALARLRDESQALPDLVLLDLNLPDINGHEVLSSIRRDPRLTALPVVVLTSSVAEEDVIEAYTGHANSYVNKPVDFQGFIEAMASLETFWFELVELPSVSQKRSARLLATDAPNLHAAGDALAVLLVEDNPGDAELVRMTLANAIDRTYDLVVKDRLQSAITHLRESSVDCVLLDLSLPDSEGLDTVRDLVSEAGNAPIIVMTGFDDEQMGERALKAGAHDYLVKGSVNDRELRRSVLFAVERSQASTAIRRAQQVESVARMAGSVAHDFNNALQVIRGQTEMLVLEHDGIESIVEAAGAIHQAAERAGVMTRQLLAFGRRSVASPRSVAVDELLRGLAPLLRGALGDRTALALELHAPGMETVIDPDLLEQSIINLVFNARDASDPDQEIILSSRYLAEGSDALAGDWPACRIDVIDHGCGIEPEIIERIFDPFYTTKGASGGSGLGLNAVLGIAQRFAGNVVVESVPGEGTTVGIVLPVRSQSIPPPREAGDENASTASRALAGRRILIVDDEAPVSAVVSAMLQGSGAVCVCANSADEAEQVLLDGSGTFDMLVTDVMMPGRTGLDLAVSVHARLPTLPILFITGYADAPELERTMSEVGADVLVKPFGAEKLIDQVSSGLDRAAGPRG